MNQFLGLIGYGLIILSLFSTTQRKVFILDFIGCIIVALHFVVLGAVGGAILSLLYAVKDLVGLIRNDFYKYTSAALIVVLMLLSPLFLPMQNRDILALIGSIIALASRISPKLATTLFLIALSTVFWGAYGFVVGSIGQVVFSTVYAIIAFVRGVQSSKLTAE